MNRRTTLRCLTWTTCVGLSLFVALEEARSQKPADSHAPADAIADAQTPKEAPLERPEQKKTAHDNSDIFDASKALPNIRGFGRSGRSRAVSGVRFLLRSAGCNEAWDDVWRGLQIPVGE